MGELLWGGLYGYSIECVIGKGKLPLNYLTMDPENPAGSRHFPDKNPREGEVRAKISFGNKIINKIFQLLPLFSLDNCVTKWYNCFSIRNSIFFQKYTKGGISGYWRLSCILCKHQLKRFRKGKRDRPNGAPRTIKS